VLDTYVLLDRIGAGGMGEVFKAEHRRMERIVALKLLHEHRIDSPETLERFLREARAAGRLVHPNIVHAYDADEADGHHFLVMEYVDGSDLAALGRERKIEIDEAVDYILQAARGLDYAHRQGVVHRDIKPGNLLRNPAGVIKILDMGIARLAPVVREGAADETEAQLTEAGLILGTIDFMSPEQALDFRNADARSDVYSLGCTLYFLLAGKPAYSGKTVVEKIFAHRDIAVPSLRAARDDVPDVLNAIVARMMAKNPVERYASMAAVIAALDEFVSGKPMILDATVNLSLEEIQAEGSPPSSAAGSFAETPTTALRPARERLLRFIEGCGGIDKFLDNDEEQSIFRRGGELELSLHEIENTLDECCASGGFTRHSKLSQELIRQFEAAADNDGAIAQDEFEAIVDYAVGRQMPRKSAEEHCLTLMLDNKWRAREGFFNAWFQRKLRQYGLE
jgi:serine/threonine protein kinase